VSGQNGLFAFDESQLSLGQQQFLEPTLVTLAPPPPAVVTPELENVPAAGNFLTPHQWVNADFNQDGLSDMANIWSTNPSGGAVGIDVYLNGGDGTFTPQAQWGRIGSTGAYFQTEKWVVGDYDKDGYPDLANVWCTVEGGAVGIDVYVNRRDHFDLEPQWGQIGSTGAFYASEKWVAADFDHDGYVDLANVWSTQDFGQTGIDVYRNDHAHHFTLQPRWGEVGTQGIFTASQSWFAGDFDGDGYPDLADVWNDVVFDSATNTGIPQAVIDVHVNTRNGHFTGSPQWGAPGTQGIFDARDKWIVGDFNGDGYPDLANAFSDDNSGFVSLDVHLNTKQRAFTDARWATLLGPYNGGPRVFNSARVQSVGFDTTQVWLAGPFRRGATKASIAYVYNNAGVAGIGELY